MTSRLVTVQPLTPAPPLRRAERGLGGEVGGSRDALTPSFPLSAERRGGGAERHQGYRHFLPKCRKGSETNRHPWPKIHNILWPAKSRPQYTQFGRSGPILAGWPYTTPCGLLTRRPQYHAFSPFSPFSPAHPGVGVFTQEANFRLSSFSSRRSSVETHGPECSAPSSVARFPVGH